ncbi:MAG: [protein-PII] uridylyltransferase [Nitratireductor sp.]|nr:[protein-PII] uridylyltransferase [Nitratireductor sp.]
MKSAITPKPLLPEADLQRQIADLLASSGLTPDSPKLRADLLAMMKSVYREKLERAEELLFKDGDGTRCAKRLSALQDTLIRAIFHFAAEKVYPSENRSKGERIAISAVGGYGRGTLAPGSDIDLLFLLPYKQTAWGEQVIEYILYFLWDMGFKVGHATRNGDECVRLSKQDMTIRTSILEARFIDGDEALLEEMEERFDKEVVRRTTAEFIEAKLKERDDRHKKSGESRYLVEPNIKDGKGGLRDLHTLYWIGKYYYHVRLQRDLVEAGLFTADEFKIFRRAEKFLWTVRCHMHFLTGKAEERLSFDLQREMAARLKYVSHGGLLDVERFMKHYFLVAKDVGDLTLIVCAKLEEEHAKSVTGINGLIRSIRFPRKKIAGSLDFINSNGRLNIADETVFERDPVNLIRMFKLADDNDLDLHPDAAYLARKSLKLIDRDLRRNEEAGRLFMSILTSRNRPEILLRKMNETGVLGRFIPAFGKIVAMMQFNMYHHYTVDEHLIRTVGVLSDIESGRLAEDHPLSARVLPDIKDREVLYLAVLIHDIAKGRKEDHSIAGARIARQLGPLLGLTPDQTNLVSWLVEEHLTMSQMAQSRDLSDHKTIQDFAHVVQSVERMRYLLILTVCDIRAVGPGVWNGWKGQLLRTLYYETELLLTGGFSAKAAKTRTEAAKTALREQFGDWPKREMEKILALPYPNYYLSTPPEDQVRHMQFLRQALSEGEKLKTGVHTLEFEEITEITVLSPDHPRLLAIVTGACSAAGANIVEAKINTLTDGRAFDSIFITRAYADERDELRRAGQVSNTIRDALTGKTMLPQIMKRSEGRMKRSAVAFRITPKVTINNGLSNRFTVVEVEGLDRPGILSELTGALADLNLNIASAQIATFGEKVVDSFYVTDLIGAKIMLESRQQKIVSTLISILDLSAGQARQAAPAA